MKYSNQTNSKYNQIIVQNYLQDNSVQNTIKISAKSIQKLFNGIVFIPVTVRLINYI